MREVQNRKTPKDLSPLSQYPLIPEPKRKRKKSNQRKDLGVCKVGEEVAGEQRQEDLKNTKEISFCVVLSSLACPFLSFPPHVLSIGTLVSLPLSLITTLLRTWNFSPPRTPPTDMPRVARNGRITQCPTDAPSRAIVPAMI